ncbi:rCG25515 [Rattus norvegicus]|uniref:RCG25515 n=1 Tax=Rattus norvegicus TaxID=10116 RepID=A6I2U5_RAT|nr:rCG25515 [Rattus norvegicus]
MKSNALWMEDGKETQEKQKNENSRLKTKMAAPGTLVTCPWEPGWVLWDQAAKHLYSSYSSGLGNLS